MHLPAKQNLPSHLPCSYGENVPASMLMYGSILIDVTPIPHALSSVPKELAMTPLPTPLMTPPVTKMYFIAAAVASDAKCRFLCEKTAAPIDALLDCRTSNFCRRTGERLHMHQTNRAALKWTTWCQGLRSEK